MTNPMFEKYGYDAEADIIHLNLAEGEYSHSIYLSETKFSLDPDLDSHILLDVSTDERVIGIEIQSASKAFSIQKRHITMNGNVPLHLIATLANGVKPVRA